MKYIYTIAVTVLLVAAVVAVAFVMLMRGAFLQ